MCSGLKLKKALFAFAKKKIFYTRRKWKTGRAQKWWCWESGHQDTVSTLPDQKQNLILESCKIPFVPYNLRYILEGDLFFHMADNVPWFQVGKSYPNTLKKCPVQKSPFFPVCRVVWKVLSLQIAWITTDDRLTLWMYTANINSISESATQGFFLQNC